MPFRLVPKSSTLDDLELLYVQIFAEFCTSWHVGAATMVKRMKTDPHLSARELLRTESTFQRCIDYVDIAGQSEVGADLVSCVLYTKAVACFPLR